MPKTPGTHLRVHFCKPRSAVDLKVKDKLLKSTCPDSCVMESE